MQVTTIIEKGEAPKKAIVKKDMKSKVAAKNGCDGRLIAKILMTTIQLNLCCLYMFHYDSVPNPNELSLLKFLLLAYHHSLSWLPPWISHLFSQWPSCVSHTFFTAGLFLD